MWYSILKKDILTCSWIVPNKNFHGNDVKKIYISSHYHPTKQKISDSINLWSLMPLMWKRAKRRQLPWLGSNLPPSTETLVIACCVNKSVQNPSQIRTNPTQIWGTECRLGGWSRDTWGQGPHKRCHCGTVQDVSQEECLTRGWNYDRPWGSLLREKGNLRWEGFFYFENVPNIPCVFEVIMGGVAKWGFI